MAKGIWEKYQSARENLTSMVAEQLKEIPKGKRGML